MKRGSALRRSSPSDTNPMGDAPTLTAVPGGEAARRAAPAPVVVLQGVTKRYGDVAAVDDLNLEIADGEFFSMLGPSGSGKTTTLRLIAGFEQPTSGAIRLLGADVTAVPPFERDVNTVFQDYALFPHMNVGDNVAYALRVRRVPSETREQRVSAALRTVRLDGFQKRRPAQLSGGQRQRVALARALVNRPRVLLLDEPLGALDRKLREEMQLELKEIQKSVGITFVFVTHDQDEALTMSDRIAVFNAGRVEQVGTPAEVYEQPKTAFVAGFVGTSNLISGDVARAIIGSPGRYAVRPEKIRLVAPDATAGADQYSATGTVRDVVYLGAQMRLLVTIAGGTELVVSEQSLTSAAEAVAQRGRQVRLVWQKQHTLVLGDDEPSEVAERRTDQ
jgi:putative spermidine/putrescine transport system ATP-binding protein